MKWGVQYRSEGVEHVLMHPTPEMAIEMACRLIDEGGDVFGIGIGIGIGPLTDSIDPDQILRIYDIWVQTKFPLRHRQRRTSGFR
jgi:hypothetical protein